MYLCAIVQYFWSRKTRVFKIIAMRVSSQVKREKMKKWEKFRMWKIFIKITLIIIGFFERFGGYFSTRTFSHSR